MTHLCYRCGSQFNCIVRLCRAPRITLCFICFSKDWHNRNTMVTSQLPKSHDERALAPARERAKIEP